MRFAIYGRQELLWYGVVAPICGSLPVLLVALVLGYWFLLPLLAVPAAFCLFVVNFFRDPDRPLPGDEFVVVSPADGTVTDVGERDEPRFIKDRAQCVGIFLSVFDVHVNRVPLDGVVGYLEHREGRYLDARDPQCSVLNESQNIGVKTLWGPCYLVRQISGKIARHIVCPLNPGDELKRGERFGMIKFGSRTELYLDAQLEVEWKVKVGQKVRGGETVLAIVHPKTRC